MRRVIGLAILTALVGAVVAYMQLSVPLPGPSLGRADIIYYWPVALIAGLVVMILTAAVVGLTRWAGRGEE